MTCALRHGHCRTGLIPRDDRHALGNRLDHAHSKVFFGSWISVNAGTLIKTVQLVLCDRAEKDDCLVELQLGGQSPKGFGMRGRRPGYHKLHLWMSLAHLLDGANRE